MIAFNELKTRVEQMGYYATEELLYDAYNALLMFESKKINVGQDIFATCLEGPPGAGKTEFAKTYTKLANSIFGNVELVEYQCDATTGKTELFEDINISAAIRGDADHVNIPGKLIEAIQKVNSGKKVVLFIDEYDKAREETDAFLLQFLQSGKINSTQHGDLEVKEKYKNNLQVILCKNDMREELSGPLSRRIRFTRLDYMKPELFYKVANRVLVENKKPPVNDGVLNLVCLMYEKAYAKKDMFTRLPACSEMLIAIEDADRMITQANAPKNVIYNIIVKNMFKSVDDIQTFEASLDKVSKESESKLSALVKTMKTIDEDDSKEFDLNSLIASKVYSKAGVEFEKKTKELEDLINSYKTKFEKMEQDRRKAIEEEIKQIGLGNGKLIQQKFPEVTKIFEDEGEYFKRGCNIFELANDWTKIASFTRYNLSHNFFVNQLIENAFSLDIRLYENGILITDEKGFKLIVINRVNEHNDMEFEILSNYPVIPIHFLNDILGFVNFTDDCYEKQPKTAKAIADKAVGIDNSGISIDALVYSDKGVGLSTQVSPNVYHFTNNRMSQIEAAYKTYMDGFVLPREEGIEKAITASKELVGKSMVINNE